MIYKILYKILWLIKGFGSTLAYDYRIQGYKGNKWPILCRLGYKFEEWSTHKIYILIEKFYGYQNGGGWLGDELEGVNDVEEYIAKKLAKIKKERRNENTLSQQ